MSRYELDELATRNRNPNANANGSRERVKRPGDDIAERLLVVATAVIRLLADVESKAGTKNLVSQLERSGPGAGANYEEARGAESPADFVHKVRVALKELRETRYWLQLCQKANLVGRHHELGQLTKECDELIAILTASARTAKRRVNMGK